MIKTRSTQVWEDSWSLVKETQFSTTTKTSQRRQKWERLWVKFLVNPSTWALTSKISGSLHQKWLSCSNITKRTPKTSSRTPREQTSSACRSKVLTRIKVATGARPSKPKLKTCPASVRYLISTTILSCREIDKVMWISLMLSLLVRRDHPSRH